MIKLNNLKNYFKDKKELIEKALDIYLPSENNFPEILFKAIRYSVFSGGKRLRPILCLAAAESIGGDIFSLLPIACAIEFIHTYSLIHDDLPMMDNAFYRRGKLSCHCIFGEHIAILTGDALLTEAFSLLSSSKNIKYFSSNLLLKVIKIISTSAGIFGMIKGQVIDLQLAAGEIVNEQNIQDSYLHKTAKMIKSSVVIGGLLSGANNQTLQIFETYGENIGFAFQIIDDILDIEGTRKSLGKNPGQDAIFKKKTYPSLLGIIESKKKAKEHLKKALDHLNDFNGDSKLLRLIAQFIVERTI